VSAVPPSLRPVAGPARDITGLLRQWLAESDPEPLVVRTSGSTGEPKDVLLSASAVRFSAETSLRRLGGPGQWVLALPPYYVAGLQVLVRSLLADLDVVLLDDCEDLQTAVEALTEARRYLACVPTQLRRWLATDTGRTALGGFDAVLVGGAAVESELRRIAADADVTVVTTYGMTETCGGCVYDGTPLDGVEVAIGADGRIRLRGPMLFDGYAGNCDVTAEVLRDGWLLTPDVGHLDRDGRLVVSGRADDVVKSGGVSVPLPAVEARLAAMPGVAEVAVLAVPDPEWGSRVVAVAAAGDSLDLTAVRDFVSAAHPRSWAPHELHLVDRLPRLASGKVDREQLVRSLQPTP
jgi:o-succinylbenzoate---CoA ligase